MQVPFDTYFNVEALENFHRVITMEAFFDIYATSIWPPDKRILFCYGARHNFDNEENVGGVCNAKSGNPFGPFWDTFGVDFVGSQTYGPLHYDVYFTDVAQDWNEKYPASEWPVLAFTGAPAPYPVQKENVVLHKYLKWNEEMTAKAERYIKSELPKGPFVGIHLRNGVDWVKNLPICLLKR